jgi:hypothetical protein
LHLDPAIMINRSPRRAAPCLAMAPTQAITLVERTGEYLLGIIAPPPAVVDALGADLPVAQPSEARPTLKCSRHSHLHCCCHCLTNACAAVPCASVLQGRCEEQEKKSEWLPKIEHAFERCVVCTGCAVCCWGCSRGLVLLPACITLRYDVWCLAGCT